MPRAAACIALAGMLSCEWSTEPHGPMRPQSVVLFATPKILSDFASPAQGAAAFLDHYAPLTSRAAETILIFAVGNSDHVLMYRGTQFWQDSVEWARYTNGLPVDSRVMNYHQLDAIVKAFKSHAASTGLNLRIYDQVDQGIEFTRNDFKHFRQPACFSVEWESFDIRGLMSADTFTYATAPGGVASGIQCGSFLVDQVAAYMTDLSFDGILYGNQLGTRGKWLPEDGPGYTEAEANAIRDFMAYSKQKFGSRALMWFDSYNNIDIERITWSVPADAYDSFDYVIASGFCAVSFPARARDNLASKLRIIDGPRVLASLDWVDPWYTYNSMTAFSDESRHLETLAIVNRFKVDGVVFFANDELGAPVPRALVESFAARYFVP